MTDGDKVSGTLIGESLRVGAVLDGVTLTVKRIWREDAGDQAVGQPERWTFIEFEAPLAEAPRLVESLSETLESEGGWYCDLRSDLETYVVFSGRSFRYARGDESARHQVEEYARSVGVPEHELDWPV